MVLGNQMVVLADVSPVDLVRKLSTGSQLGEDRAASGDHRSE